MKLNPKERAKFEEAEGHIRARFPNYRCLFEIIKPKDAAHIAVLASYVLTFNESSRVVILQVSAEGSGWEIFAAPSVGGISDTFQTICSMWNNPNQTGS